MADRNSTRKCQRCDTEFQATNKRGPRPNYCSQRCRLQSSIERRAGMPTDTPRGPAPTEPYPCEVCGKHYQRPVNADGSFRKSKHNLCGSTCGYIKREGREYWTPKPASCVRCRSQFIPNTQSQRYCGSECRHADVNDAHVPAEPAYSNCIECGNEFRSIGPRHKFCGRACYHAACKRDPRYIECRRIQDSRRRARKRTTQTEPISPTAVFERDRWVCHLCRKKTLKSKRGTAHDRAPELEHIISLSDGGTHTWGNVACSCKRCNHEKRANSIGQLGLEISC